jgi:DNA-binding transcriptional LysR family regulator
MDSLQLRSRQIEVFRAVMRAGGASAAARLLGLSQPLVSQQLAALEKALELPLFERKRGRLVPTREGAAFHSEVERHYLGMEQLARKARSLRGAEDGQLFVGCLPGLGFTLMPEVVRQFCDRYPQVRVSLQTVSSGVVKDRVASGEWDIGFAASEIDTAGVMHSVFSRSLAVAVLPAGHPAARGRKPLSLADLARFPLVALNPEDVARQQLEKACEQQGVKLRIAAETPYGTGICALVRAGLGIGVTNPLSVPQEAEGGLVMRKLETEIAFSSLVLFPPHAPATLWAKEFLKLARICLDKQLRGRR